RRVPTLRAPLLLSGESYTGIVPAIRGHLWTIRPALSGSAFGGKQGDASVVFIGGPGVGLGEAGGDTGEAGGDTGEALGEGNGAGLGGEERGAVLEGGVAGGREALPGDVGRTTGGGVGAGTAWVGAVSAIVTASPADRLRTV